MNSEQVSSLLRKLLRDRRQYKRNTIGACFIILYLFLSFGSGVLQLVERRGEPGQTDAQGQTGTVQRGCAEHGGTGVSLRAWGGPPYGPHFLFLGT